MTSICRQEIDNSCANEPNAEDLLAAAARVKPLTNAQKLRKVIFELIETERNYVKVSPLKKTML